MTHFHHLRSEREIALRAWDAEYGKPYRWGGDDPIAGWDCSGLVIEGLKAAGVLPRVGDWTASGLANRLGTYELQPGEPMEPGALLFWKRGEGIGHVEIVWAKSGDRVWTLGAGGGGPSTRTRDDAVEQNAYVRIRPAEPGWVLAVDPFL